MEENQSSASPKQLHIVLFPFMSKGHTIPLLHLAKLIHKHRPQASFTVFTTPANEPFVSASLSSIPPNNITVVSLPLSITDDERIPPGVESTDQLPSMSLFHSFACATKSLQPHFEAALESIQNGRRPITLLVSDGFLYWIHESTAKFDFRRLAFFGMNLYASAISVSAMHNNVFSRVESDHKPIHVPDFPWISVRKDDFEESFHVSDPQDPRVDFNIKCFIGTATSHALVVNSCVELEQPFLDYMNSIPHPKCLCVGPLCLAETAKSESLEKPAWINWLDAKLGEGKSVLYVAFGSQAEISSEQLKEITIGLEKSGVNFIWVLRMKSNQDEIMSGFEERVKDKGLVVRSWVNQREILEHQSVGGFLSHCGWNSAIESICAGVPILAWPMMAEQHLNVKLVVEEVEVGLRVETCDGSRRGFVRWEGLSKMIKVLMEEDMGKRVRINVEELSKVVKKCVEEGGSSWRSLESLLNELEMEQKSNKGCEGKMINGHGSTNNNI